MSDIFLDPRSQRDFDLNGYAVVRLLSDDQLDAVAAEVDAFARGGMFAPNGQSGYHATYLAKDVDYRRQAEQFVRSAVTESAMRLVKGYRMVAGGFVFKWGGDGTVTLHRDWTITDDVYDITFDIWCPLVDSDESNGTMRFVPGSHRLVHNVESFGVEPYWKKYHEQIRAMSVAVPVKRGEALIFDTGILHWSGPNPSGTPRPVLLSTWIPVESRPVFYALDTSRDGERFEMFDMEGGGLTDFTPEEFGTHSFDRPSLGFVENRNEVVPFERFQHLLEERREMLRHQLNAA